MVVVLGFSGGGGGRKYAGHQFIPSTKTVTMKIFLPTKVEMQSIFLSRKFQD